MTEGGATDGDERLPYLEEAEYRAITATVRVFQATLHEVECDAALERSAIEANQSMDRKPSAGGERCEGLTTAEIRSFLRRAQAIANGAE